MLCFFLLNFAAAAQSLNQDVHVVPYREPAKPAASKPALVPEPPAADPSLIVRTKPLRYDVDLVLVPVTITDEGHRPVMDLQKHDFSLYEAEQEQQIRYFSMEDAPVSIGILLDLSRSMSNKIVMARAGVEEFLKTANPDDDYFVIGFADRPELLAETTTSQEEIVEKLEAAEAKGHTALLDAIYLGMHRLRWARHQRRALLIISDGGDNHSRYGADEIKRLVQESDVEIYAIGLFDSFFKTPEEWRGEKLLNSITAATGGRTIKVKHLNKLPEAAGEIGLELRNQYMLGYHSSARHDGQWRKIKVRVTSAAHAIMQVYAKQGYIAPER